MYRLGNGNKHNKSKKSRLRNHKKK